MNSTREQSILVSSEFISDFQHDKQGDYLVYVCGHANSPEVSDRSSDFDCKFIGFSVKERIKEELVRALALYAHRSEVTHCRVFGMFKSEQEAYNFLNQTYHDNSETLWNSQHPTVRHDQGYECPVCKVQVTEAVTKAYPLFPKGL